MPFTRTALAAVAVAVGAVAPAAHAFVEYCVPHAPQSGHDVYVCHRPEQPGCVYGSLGAEGAFRTPACA